MYTFPLTRISGSHCLLDREGVNKKPGCKFTTAIIETLDIMHTQFVLKGDCIAAVSVLVMSLQQRKIRGSRAKHYQQEQTDFDSCVISKVSGDVVKRLG